MFVDFFYELRRRGLKVGAQEILAVVRALSLNLHETTLDGFYAVSRALIVHREGDLDKFDAAFAYYFHGVESEALKLTEELLAWLRDPVLPVELTEEQKKLLESLDLEEARRQLEERLREQRERHDRGDRWVGTGGTSPFGRRGFRPGGISIGGEGRREGRGMGSIRLAEERRFRELRSDVTLDTRAIELALRRLRRLSREGALTELDLEATIDQTAQNAGELEVVLRPPRRSNLRVLLLLDVGGSMDPHAELCSRLFSAAKRATHWKELRTYYFHNCIYGHVYPRANLQDGIDVDKLLAECDPEWRLILVGDALMNPAELWATGGWWTYRDQTDLSGLAWLMRLAQHFRRCAWLNPEDSTYWNGTAEVIGRVFRMYRLTLDGLGEAVRYLSRSHGPR